MHTVAVSRRRTAWTVGVGGIAVVAFACWLLGDRIHSAATAVVIALPILAASWLGGRRIGVVVGAIGAVAYAAIFITPFGHVTVGPTQDGLVLAVFIATGFLVGAVADRHRPAPVVPPIAPASEQGVLLRAVSHDLRNPLSTIRLASSDLLTDVDDTGGRRAELLSLVLSESERLDRIVGNLLSAGRVQAGALRPSVAAESLPALIDASVARFGRVHPGQRIDVDAEADLPDALVDAVQIDQVLTNLVENSWRVSPPGAPIVIRVRRLGELLEVAVVDRGPGFPAGSREAAFEPHHSTMGSSGLGLSVARAIVEAHGGTIELGDDREGTGAEVTFTVPLADQ